MACFYLEHDVTKVQTVHLCAKLTRAFPGDVLAPLARCYGFLAARGDAAGAQLRIGDPLRGLVVARGARRRTGGVGVERYHCSLQSPLGAATTSGSRAWALQISVWSSACCCAMASCSIAAASSRRGSRPWLRLGVPNKNRSASSRFPG